MYYPKNLTLKPCTFRLHLYETRSTWNRYKIGTNKHCEYTGPGRPAIDRFSYPVTNGFNWESDPF